MSAPGPSFVRRNLPVIAAGTVLLLAGATTLVGGCIRRVPAPTDDAPADSPYSAVATWLEVTIPPQSEGHLAPLPPKALRLAFGSQGRVWMDSALVDGREQAVTLDDLPAALKALGARTEPIVLLGFPTARCERLSPIADRISVAVGTSRFSEDGKAERRREESLQGQPFRAFCSTDPPDAEEGDD